MSRDGERRTPQGLEGELDLQLRRAVDDGADFDYAALVAGTRSRATRLRRRQTVTRAVAAAVLVPTLVGAGWIAGQTLGGAPAQVELADTGETSTAPPTQEQTAAPDRPPYQDVDVLPPVAPDEGNPDYPNAWPVPDARPTGVEFLDALGAPSFHLTYPRVVPLDIYLAARADDGVEPVSGVSWGWGDGTNDLEQDTVAITVTGWEDSATALAQLRDDTLEFATWFDGFPTELPWPDGVDGADGIAPEDRMLVSGEGVPGASAGVLVRQGDYLVGVTVNAGTEDEAVQVAVEIAGKTAANLLHLDAEHAAG